MDKPTATQLKIWKRFTELYPEAAAEINRAAREDVARRTRFMSVRRSKAEVDAFRSSGASGTRSRIVGEWTEDGAQIIGPLPEDTWAFYAKPWASRARQR